MNATATNRRLPTLVLAGLSLLSACGSGGGGSGGAAPAAGPTTLWIDSTAGSETVLEGQVVGARLQAVDGSTTGELLTSNAVDLTIASPQGQPFLLQLGAVPEGDYQAVLLAMAPGATRGHRSGVPIEFDPGAMPNVVRVEFESPFRRSRGSDDWFHVGHRGGVRFEASGNREKWVPDFWMRRGDDSSFSYLELVVVGVDAQTESLTAIPTPRHGPVTFRVVLAPNAVLTLHDQYRLLSNAEFFAMVRNGAKLRVRGTVAADRTLTVQFGELRIGGSGNSGENKIYARVETAPVGTQFTVQPLSIVRGGSPGGVLSPRTVDAGLARIYRSGNSHLSLPISAIAVGQWVEIEWNGPFAADPIPAKEVEIESDSSGHSHPEIEGQVGAVDRIAGTLTMVQRRDDPLVVGGRRVQSLVVRIGAGTNLFRQDDRRVSITLDQVFVGERVWARGTLDANGVLDGSWVRIRSR